MRLSLGQTVAAALCAMTAALALAPASSQAAFNDPLFLMRPVPQEPPPGQLPPPRIPPAAGELEGPCGIAVDATGRVYVSDYYHDSVDLFGSNLGPGYPYGYLSQTGGFDPIDGPCGIALDAAGNLYVNDFHRAVIAVGKGTIDGAPLNEAHPTGVAVDPVSERLYVNERTGIAVYDLAGNRLGEIGEGSLADGYGLAVSRFPGTLGQVYVPDAADDTVKVYAPLPALPGAPPVATIDGSGTPRGHFTSLRDSSVAVDNVSGEIYVADNLQPQDASRPEAVVYVFDATGTYEGRLKYSVVFGLPLGIAVDNSPTASQGRVYVTTSNTSPGGIYAYPPGAASSAAVALPEPFSLGGTSSGSGSGSGVAAPSASAGSAPMPLAGPVAVVGATGPASAVPGLDKNPRSKPRRYLKRRRAKPHRSKRNLHSDNRRTHR